MTPVLLALLVSLAGGAGAAARFLVDTAIPVRIRERFPLGTFLINVSGSFVLGLIAGPLSAIVLAEPSPPLRSAVVAP